MSKQRDPVQGEFFNTESITTLAAQLTREGIGQNPMDAFVSYPVHVRVHVSGAAGAVSPLAATEYFRALREHVAACDPGAASQLDGSCRFLVVEDFNTSGLRGDPEASEEPLPGIKNDFFFFFRAEGKSGKSGADRGRWGVGKYVFPMASHINTFFGLTIREPNGGASGGTGPLLMGQTVLKNHQLHGRSFEPDGWWAEFNDQGVPVPITNPAVIAEFRETWKVTRSSEPGLSIVIPYIREDLTAVDLTRAIVRDYYFAVLSGKFTVEIDSPDLQEPVLINPATLDDVVNTLPESEREELHRQISLARWHSALANGAFIPVSFLSHGAPKWVPDTISDVDRNRIRAALDAGERIAIRVPVEVRLQRAMSGTMSFFDVVLAPEPGYTNKPTFVREGLFVPEVSSAKLAGIRCFVIIEDRALAQMVGDAEGPAHTNWSAQTQKFTGKYRYGQQWLTFVKRAPAEILRIARAEDEQADPTLLARYFPLPVSEPRPPTPGSGKGRPGPGRTPPPPPPPPPPRPRRMRVEKIVGGFSVHLTGEGSPVERIRIRTAYDRRGGNPFTKWRAADFDLTRSEFQIELKGGTLEQRAGNQLKLSVDNPQGFSLHVRGFDVRRDLRVDARPEVAE
jgi:hypothetical protein